MPQSFISFHYHIVFSTKNREPWISHTIENRLWEYLGGIIRGLGGVPLSIGGVEDHIHMLVQLQQDRAFQDVLRELKAVSSGWVRKTFPGLVDFRWQIGYAAFTVSHSHLTAVSSYITTQREHHKQESGLEELIRLLQKHEMPFREEYLQ